MCCADFNYYINRQGIQGRKGEKGDKGFSPTINVSTDTVDEYKLIIANEDNTFETPNLRGNINVLDNGGTYLRYDKETQQISAQDMDAATASTLGGVRLSTGENIAAMSADTVVTPADVADALPIYLQGEGAVSITQDAETSKTKINVDLSSVNELTTRVSNAEAEIVGIQADVANIDADVSTLNSVTANHTASISAINNNIADLNNNKVAKTDFATTETAGVVKVDGTTIIADGNGVISSVGGGSTGDVTSDGDNTFTGNNTFSKTILATGSDALLVDNRTNSWTSPQGVEFTKGNDGISHEINYNFTVADGSGNEYQAPVENVTLAASGDLILKANNNNISSNALLTSTPTIKDGDGNIILSQGNIIAGDNVAIEKTPNGIKINGNTDSYTKSETDALLSEKNDNIFDISKFTVVGSPTITEDGIASGFSSNSYLTKSFNKKISSNFELYIKLKNFDYDNTRQNFLILFTANYYYAIYVENNGHLYLRVPSENGSSFIEKKCLVADSYKGKDLYLKYEVRNKKTVTLSYSDNGKDYILGNTITFMNDNTYLDLENIYKIGGVQNTYYIGSIDLKHFSILVGSKEVFNGLMSSTKPIYDAIKANNTELSEFKTETSNDFSAVNSALNEKANLSDLSLKQNKLVSGTNIKTINGQSVLGEGDITVGGSTPTNMVTTDTVQTITGQKSFTNSTKFGASGHAGNIAVGDLSDAYFNIYGNRSGANRYLSIDANGSAASLEGSWFTQNELYYSKGTTGTISGNIPSDSIRYLHEGLIEAGNGIVIESSTKLNGAGAIKISSTGATINDVTPSTTSTYSSNKIDSLVGNISTVLDSINGEVI